MEDRFNRERVDSSGRQQFVERSIINRTFTIDRQVGISFEGTSTKVLIKTSSTTQVSSPEKAGASPTMTTT